MFFYYRRFFKSSRDTFIENPNNTNKNIDGVEILSQYLYSFNFLLNRSAKSGVVQFKNNIIYRYKILFKRRSSRICIMKI